MENQPQNPNQPKTPLCVRCNVHLQPIAQFPIRIGGSAGAALTGWSEYNERIIHFDTYRCPICRKLEFFDWDSSLPSY